MCKGTSVMVLKSTVSTARQHGSNLRGCHDSVLSRGKGTVSVISLAAETLFYLRYIRGNQAHNWIMVRVAI